MTVRWFVSVRALVWSEDAPDWAPPAQVQQNWALSPTQIDAIVEDEDEVCLARVVMPLVIGVRNALEAE